jgi:hypothetical protein
MSSFSLKSIRITNIIFTFAISMKKIFPQYNRIVIYPQQHAPDVLLKTDHPIFLPFKIYQQKRS